MGGAMSESDKTLRRSAKRTRCAIYTRKSSEEGLEQAFNSLDAQREACTAFIAPHQHGTADAECPFVLRPVRAGSHRRTNPRQGRRIQEKGHVDGRHAAPWV